MSNGSHRPFFDHPNVDIANSSDRAVIVLGPHALLMSSDGPRYDRNKLFLKEIMNVQYISCMNPTAGSFTINPRLQVKDKSGWHVGPNATVAGLISLDSE